MQRGRKIWPITGDYIFLKSRQKDCKHRDNRILEELAFKRRAGKEQREERTKCRRDKEKTNGKMPT